MAAFDEERRNSDFGRFRRFSALIEISGPPVAGPKLGEDARCRTGAGLVQGWCKREAMKGPRTK
jgi:hypothetical protein